MFQPVGLDSEDVNFLLRNNIAKKQDDNVVWDDDQYQGTLFNEIMQMSNSKNLKDYDGSFFFWALPIDVFQCFAGAYVLTYMFEYQMLKYFFDVNGVQYELIGTKRTNGVYHFCPLEEMNRKRDLRSKVHINYTNKYNEIGNRSFSLSSSWFERASKEPNQPSLMILKNNLYNIFRHNRRGNGDRMWTTLNKYKSFLKGKGYSSGFITFNKRATNQFADRHDLAYCVNVFMQPWMKNYLMRLGAEGVNEDMYALSVLIQWVFRSALRKNEEINIYIPSKRMRFLLREWLENLANGEDLKPIKFLSKENKSNGEATALVQSKNTKRRKT